MSDTAEKKKKAKKTTPVWKKSEFWTTVTTSVSGLLLAFGIITPAQAGSVAQFAPNIIGALLALLSTSKFVETQHREKIEVFRAMCALGSEKQGEVTTQGLETAEDRVADIARAVGL